MKIGIIIDRIGDVDGVALETEKWIHILQKMGHEIFIMCGRNGDLSILAIDGRFRESVGATHHDMAEILKVQGMVNAVCFDPGGSSTLVVDNKILIISSYNHDYERDVYSLPPEPRAVVNALMVW